MMVYKYWDDITREDLEFSVGSKAAVWEVKDPLLSNGDDEDTSSERYPVPPPLPGYPSSTNGSYSNFQNQSQPGQGQYPYPGFKAGGGGGGGGNAPSLVGGVSGAQLYGSQGKRGYPPGGQDRY